ncbi:hypothetical protein GCM10027020_27660 [Nocardioides salsibiostraticola]
MVGLVLGLSAALAGCGTGEASSESSTDFTEQSSPRALVAAVEANLERPVKQAAPLFSQDLDYYHPEQVDPSTLALEVSLDEEVGDNSHVRLVVSRDMGSFDDFSCDSDEGSSMTGCEDSTTGEGDEQRLAWEAFAPEEDPGYISVTVRRDDRVIAVLYYGEEVPSDLPDSDLAGLADALVALAADPAVGFTTTAAYAEAGAALDDDVMLDWFGQGNGFAPPPGYAGED